MGKSLVLLLLFAFATAFPVRAQKMASVRMSNVATSYDQEVDKSKTTWLTALYLRPIGQTASRRENWPLVPAQLLEGIPSDSILTSEGPKSIRQVRKGNIVYHREPGTKVVSTWEVRIVQRKARQVNASDLASLKDGFNSPDNRVAWDR